jgi:hypothetical protein
MVVDALISACKCFATTSVCACQQGLHHSTPTGRTHSSCVEKLSPGLLVLAKMDAVDCKTFALFGIACDAEDKTEQLFEKVACELFCCCNERESSSRGYGDEHGENQSHLYQSCVKVTVQAVDHALNGNSPFKAEHYFTDFTGVDGTSKKGFFDLAYVPKGSSEPSLVSEMKFKNDPEDQDQLDRYADKVGGSKNVIQTDEVRCQCKAGEASSSGLTKLVEKGDAQRIKDALDKLKESPNPKNGNINSAERGSKIAAEVAGQALKKMIDL